MSDAPIIPLLTAIDIVRSQAFYPDTHTGKRQQWIKDEIERKLRAAAMANKGDAA